MRQLLLLLLLCPWLGGCFLTAAVWAGYGKGKRVGESLVASYDVDCVAAMPAADGETALELHGVQRDGAVADWVRSQCGPDLWLRCEPDGDTEVALAIWEHPAFTVDRADFLLEITGEGIGALWRARLLLTASVAPSQLGATTPAAPADLAPAPPADAPIGDSMRRCAVDLAKVDWSLAAGSVLTTTSNPEVIAWRLADGTRCRPPVPPADAEPVDAALSLRRWPMRWRELDGARVTLRCRDDAGAPVLIELDAAAAWIYARCGRAVGGSVLLDTNWYASPGDPEAARAHLLPVTTAKLVVHTAQFHYEREGLGSTLLRILATPFAAVGDIATGYLVAVFAAWSHSGDDDDDCK